ncbi:uncharacterized protein LOC104443801 [Eucalyptus grandis]|uniref:uncharacterized protein LOC104443801 n=1 Tax=Eucalyptus grandis TaxID=71139 RepID=UPI00192ED0DB|nr:uncharacterized protein LOC104443801 [Eucalyptus grandis]
MGELTLTGLLQKAASDFPDGRAVSACGELDLTHAQLQELVDRAAALLVASGIGAGDVVALAFPNTIEFVILLLAVIRCQATAAPLDPICTAKEFEFYLSDTEPKLLLTPQERNQRAQSAASKLNIPHVTAKFHSANSRITLSSTDIEPSLELMFKVVNDPSDVALFLHPSSTTSRPKRMLLTQGNLASSVQNIKRVYKLTESDSTVIVLPLFHVHGLVAGLLSSLAAGAAVALPAAVRFSVPTFWADMISYNATWYTADAIFHKNILKHHLSKPKRIYPKLRFITSCSASLAPSIISQLEKAFNAPVLKTYAMTEATHLMASNPLPEDGEHKPESVGSPVGQEMAIMDARFSASGSSADGAAREHYMSEVAGPCPSDDTPEGDDAPKTTEENKTESERGAEEGGHRLKLTVELEMFNGPTKFSYEELMIATADRKILGKGGFGVVYEGCIGKAHTPVAVKLINSHSHQGLKEYTSEVMTLGQLSHKNLVPLIGYCHEEDKFILVYEFMSEGNLEDHLFKGRSLLTWERRYKIAQGLASALHYLQKQCRQCVIHRDIKSSNIMLDEEFEAKLGDFGLARLGDHARGSQTTELMGTMGYVAPEYCVTGKATEETDIYSFGLVLLELGSGRRVIDLKRDPIGLAEWLRKHYGPKKLVNAVDERLGKDFDKKQAEALLTVGLWCAHPIADSRPSIEEAMAVLNLKAKAKLRELPSKMPPSPLCIDRKVSAWMPWL